jgi:hypothetical protein
MGRDEGGCGREPGIRYEVEENGRIRKGRIRERGRMKRGRC